jgi:hypothetical protein
MTGCGHWATPTFSAFEKETTMRNESTATNKPKNNPVPPAQQPNSGAEKHKKLGEDDDTRNTGFRSTRIRESEKRTQDSGDPSIP